MKTILIKISGIVQGVGFRPFIYKLAHESGITGYVLNNSDGVEILAQGSAKKITGFTQNIPIKKPPQSVIDSLIVENLPPSDVYPDFTIREISRGAERNTRISPDLTVCPDCLQELLNPDDRRYYYPFINCTNCGPRYTIIQDLPYDRSATTMSIFPMCPQCQSEYNDPLNRRFHAQPNACHHCGPHLELWDSRQNLLIKSSTSHNNQQLIIQTAEILKKGLIIAVKGIGGFHLACDATNEDAVNRLRARKHRWAKPLALMVKDVVQAAEIVVISSEEMTRLQALDRPIVLLKKKNSAIAESVSPDCTELGIMLAYTPLHFLIFQHLDFPLVMTSANISEEPIIFANEEAFQELDGIADYYLFHNREIYIRCDDSVLRFYDQKDYFIRRSRGSVPNPLIFKKEFSKQIIALGAEQKNTVCVTKNRQVFLSQHIGDLKNLKTYQAYQHTIHHLCRMMDVKPEIAVHDLHPQYLSTRFILEPPADFRHLADIPVIAVQHHHAHAVSCMAEYELDHAVIAVVLDGTGYGADETIWGGEILIADLSQYRRAASLQPARMPGGDAAIKNIWRMGLAYLYELYHTDVLAHLPPAWGDIPLQEIKMVVNQLEKGYNCPTTTSCGRLFDGIAALSGFKFESSYEGQAAIDFEQAINIVADQKGYSFALITDQERIERIDWRIIVDEVIQDSQKQLSAGIIAYKFHLGLIDILTAAVKKISRQTGITEVVLSGGCFMNMFLTDHLKSQLEGNQIVVYTHTKVPCNDGGLCLGQAMIAETIYKSYRQ